MPDDAGAGTADESADILDAVFAISCRSLPVDHAHALSQAVQAALPWFAQEPGAGLHAIHGAASGSGWMRPEEPEALMHLTRRAKPELRLPRRRMQDASALLGRTLDVAGSALRIDAVTERPLSRIGTLFSRCVVLDCADDEAAFLAAAGAGLAALGVRPERMLCGRVTPVATPEQIHLARSLMVAGLATDQSLVLQKEGLGLGRTIGCGLFIPHKDIADLRSRAD